MKKKKLVIIRLMLTLIGSFTGFAQDSEKNRVAEEWEQISTLAEQRQNEGQFAKAEVLYQKALAYAEKVLGPEDPYIAGKLGNLANLYEDQCRYTEAEPLYRRSLCILEKVRGPDHPEVAGCLARIAFLIQTQGQYAEAEPLFRRSLAIYEKSLGPDHPSVATSAYNLAVLFHAQGRYAEAEPLFLRDLTISKKVLGPDHIDVATSLNTLGVLYQAQGRYAEVEPLYQSSLAIYEKALGSDHPYIATSLVNLASLNHSLGRYAEAEPLYQRSLSIREKALGPDHPDVASSLNGLAVLYIHQGRYAEGEPLYQRSLAIWEKALGPDHPYVATSLNNLAALNQDLGRYAEAELLYQHSLAIREKALGTDHPDVATSLNNLAFLYQAQGRFADAKPLYQRSLAIQEKALGTDHPDVADSLNNLAALNQDLGRYAEADPLFQRAIAIRKRALGLDHPDIARSLNNLAKLYFEKGDSRTLEYAQRAFDTESAVKADNFSMMSEQQRMDFVQYQGNGPLWITASLALQSQEQDSEAARVAWQMLLRSKAAVLDASLEDRLNLAGNPEAEKLFSRLSEIKGRQSALQLRDLSELDTDAKLAAYRAQLDLLQQERNDLEQQLARISGRFAGGRRAAKVTAAEVGQALPENTALVEFLHLSPLTRGNTNELPARYLAFVLTDGTLPPAFIPLGEAAPIDRLIEQCRIKMEQGFPVEAELQELYRLVWAPIEAATQGKPRLLISPDGALNQLPFAALLTPDKRYLIDHYEIGYIASGRDLIRTVDDSQAQPPALFGDPAFERRLPTSGKPAGAVFRSVPGDRDRAMYRNLQLPALPGTRAEVEQISKTLSSKTPAVFLGSEATEETLKTTLRPEILHLATHGFYFPQQEETNSRAPQSNPMLRSGLALSGASVSATENSPATGEDGIVTAEEVGSLDLWGTRLVVLSACDTGRGETLSGEGVLGLRRAFVQAGTENLMLTLWRVEDDVTKNLMLDFYRDYLQSGDAIGALSRIQRNRMTSLEPRYWAPFLISIQGNEGGRK